ncbi:MAG: hypothetical protein M3Z16_12185 [Pseudomonadota bacterium]|nr:hypothetical protein [Pseudomonadota bacterium]
MFTVRIDDVFAMRSRGMVLAGSVQKGRVAAGDRAILRTPSAAIATVVAGVEQERKAVRSASAGEKVALLIRWIDPDELRDGLEPGQGTPGEWRVVALEVVNVPRRWWQVWR